MTERQWELLKRTIVGEAPEKLPTGFIIDSPWLPGWYGCSTLDYYTNDEVWFDANKKAVETFPDSMFLPGFWAEYGMCTEPSAFGAKCVWEDRNLPHAHQIFKDADEFAEQIGSLSKPNPKKDGLLPFVINRLKNKQTAINEIGHHHRFAVARGPLNIASFLVGTTDFLMALKLYEEESHTLLKLVSDFLTDWIELQLETFPDMDGILLLDDIVGFIGDEDMRTFVVPYIKGIYDRFDVSVNFLHNDAEGRVCAPYLPEMGVNLFNYSFNHSIAEMKAWTGGKVTLLGNIPPRDVLAKGIPDEIEASVRASMNGVDDSTRIVMSCGGGMPQDVTTESIRVFEQAVAALGSCV